MILSIFKRFFGSANERIIKSLKPIVENINSQETEYKKLSDDQLREKTNRYRQRIENGESLDSILIDAFATVREAAKRVLGERHFDVQLMGGIVLHRGMVSEMKTGEGKTLVSTLPTYLNALSGKGVHLVTVNDYLAKRDAEWMGKIYNFLGLSVGCILHNLNDDERRKAYAADITYGTNNEFGFDYLRDNMKFSKEEMVQRNFNFAIVDEVDNILIDEARTPLIISGPSSDSSELYLKVDRVIPFLEKKDYEKDEKANSVILTESGTQHVEDLLKKEGLLKGNSLYDIQNVSLVHHTNQALRAHTLFKRDKDYIVKDNQVIIIDEFTGRMMEGRRFSEGLHQALEAKENVKVQLENQTLASITFQNYFRLYPKLSGMTGTADTEATELSDIYKLDVVVIPTNKSLLRKDFHDEIYRTGKEKYEAIMKLIQNLHLTKQPVLVGTTSIEKSEYISSLLKKNKIPHKVLNARYHEQEAEIITQAGSPGAVTIATNMAGRGTDIQLGGNVEMLIKQKFSQKNISEKKEKIKIEKEIKNQINDYKKLVKETGGLYVIGTERHESRRIDNQLRGRSGRQGDPGKSKFFLSLEDDLMRIFAPERLDGMLQKLGLAEGEPIIHPWVNKAIEKAQQKVEARNYDIRKQLLKFDDVMNDQRKVIYEQRRELMEKDEINDTIISMRKETINELINKYVPQNSTSEQWEITSLHQECQAIFSINLPIKDWVKEGQSDIKIKDNINNAVKKLMDEKDQTYGSEFMRSLEKNLLLRILDDSWKEHLRSLDQIRQSIHLRAYAQRDPLNEYKGEAFNLFQNMLDNLGKNITGLLAHTTFENNLKKEELKELVLKDKENLNVKDHPDPSSPFSSKKKASGDIIAGSDNYKGKIIKRNDLCFCGSGKRYKHCHGRK